MGKIASRKVKLIESLLNLVAMMNYAFGELQNYIWLIYHPSSPTKEENLRSDKCESDRSRLEKLLFTSKSQAPE